MNWEKHIRLAVLMSTLCFVLWMNASKFDATEVRTLVVYFLTAAGFEGGASLIKNLKKGTDDASSH